MKIALFGIRKGAEDWEYELLTEGDRARVEAVREIAKADGFDRFSECVDDGRPPDFVGTIAGLTRKRKQR